MTFLVACGSGDSDRDDDRRDGQPVWILAEGYVDENFYSVGVAGAGIDQVLPERVNSAQIDAINKMKSQIGAHASVLLDNWTGTMLEVSRAPVDEEALIRSMEAIIDRASSRSLQVERWTDPETGDCFVLLKLEFSDFVGIVKKQISQLIAQELKDDSRLAHVELDRELETFRRRRLGG